MQSLKHQEKKKKKKWCHNQIHFVDAYHLTVIFYLKLLAKQVLAEQLLNKINLWGAWVAQ